MDVPLGFPLTDRRGLPLLRSRGGFSCGKWKEKSLSKTRAENSRIKIWPFPLFPLPWELKILGRAGMSRPFPSNAF